jgi:hypothetical protein
MLAVPPICLQRARAWLVATLAIVSGCAVAPSPPSVEIREKLGAVAIAPAQYVPHSNFATFAKSKPGGAAKGAAESAAGSAIILGALGATATGYAAVTLAFMAPYVIVVAAAASAAQGARTALPAEKAREIESTLNDTLAKLDAQRALADRLAAIVKSETWVQLRTVEAKGPAGTTDSPTYAALGPAGVDAVIEIAVSEIGFLRCESLDIYGNPNDLRCPPDFRRKPMVSLYMLARARLVRVSDGTELFARQFRYASPHRDFAQWAADGGRMLAAEFERAYGELAGRINDELLLVAPFELPNLTGFDALPDNPLFGLCGLVPVYPKAEPITISEALAISFTRRDDLCLMSPIRFGTVDSLRPTLRWSAFPRELDREKLASALLEKVRDVTYDLRIWEAERCERGRLVYERTGLSSPEHRLETVLAPAQRYFWSSRARFAVDDRPMATDWAFFDAYTCRPNDVAPEWWGERNHRFMTPP